MSVEHGSTILAERSMSDLRVSTSRPFCKRSTHPFVRRNSGAEGLDSIFADRNYGARILGCGAREALAAQRTYG